MTGTHGQPTDRVDKDTASTSSSPVYHQAVSSHSRRRIVSVTSLRRVKRKLFEEETENAQLAEQDVQSPVDISESTDFNWVDTNDQIYTQDDVGGPQNCMEAAGGSRDTQDDVGGPQNCMEDVGGSRDTQDDVGGPQNCMEDAGGSRDTQDDGGGPQKHMKDAGGPRDT